MLTKNAITGLTCLTFFLLKSAPSFSAPMMVTLLPSGNVIVQSVSGGSTRKATSSEISSWKGHSSLLSTTSPDGRYQVSKVELEDKGVTVFRVIRVRDGRVVLGSTDISRLMSQEFFAGNWLYFNGWLPDSGEIGISTNSHTSSSGFWEHGVIDLPSRRLIAFNGFVSPNMKFAIVPGKPGRIEETFENNEVEPGHRLETKGDIRWYVTALPRNIGSYHFSSARARPMLLNGKPFPFFFEIIKRMTEEDPTQQHSAVIFSSEGRWAICHASHYIPQLQRFVDVDYLVSMTTGIVHKLPGSQTRFL